MPYFTCWVVLKSEQSILKINSRHVLNEFFAAIMMIIMIVLYMYILSGRVLLIYQSCQRHPRPLLAKVVAPPNQPSSTFKGQIAGEEFSKVIRRTRTRTKRWNMGKTKKAPLREGPNYKLIDCICEIICITTPLITDTQIDSFDW